MIGNDCLLGQIATFIEDLHLSYDEVVNKIPYRNLLIMKKDKMRLATGDVVKKIKGKDFAKKRKGYAL